MAATKTGPSKVSVVKFIASVENETRRGDAEVLLDLFASVTGWKAQIWGPNMIGFGSYQYTYDSGHSGSMFVVGFAPRNANTVIYLGHSFPEYGALLKQLGKVKTSVSCIYVNKVADIDLEVLETMIGKGAAAVKKKWPVTAS